MKKIIVAAVALIGCEAAPEPAENARVSHATRAGVGYPTPAPETTVRERYARVAVALPCYRDAPRSGIAPGAILSVTSWSDGREIDRSSAVRDLAGRLLSETWHGKGLTWAYRYDDLDRLVEVQLPEGLTAAYAYEPESCDPASLVIGSVVAGELVARSRQTWERDEAGRLVAHLTDADADGDADWRWEFEYGLDGMDVSRYYTGNSLALTVATYGEGEATITETWAGTEARDLDSVVAQTLIDGRLVVTVDHGPGWLGHEPDRSSPPDGKIDLVEVTVDEGNAVSEFAYRLAGGAIASSSSVVTELHDGRVVRELEDRDGNGSYERITTHHGE